jgi:hypothetical protein
MRLTPDEHATDREALRLRWRKSPLDPEGRLNVVEATEVADTEHGMAVIRKADGTIRTTKIQTGSGGFVSIEYYLDDGERLLGLVHSHPNVGTGPRFSTGDLNTARETGVPLYLLQPRSTGFGVQVFDPVRNKIYNVP